MTDSADPAVTNRRPKSRAEQIALDHDLEPYQPKIGDIVTAFHLFKDPDEIQKALKEARERGEDPAAFLANLKNPMAKFRPMLVMAARDGRALLVPISSSPEIHGRHMAMSEPSELRAAGLADHKPSYVKVLEAAEYDFPHPLVLPVTGDDGKPTWQSGTATKEMRGQAALEMQRQKKAGRIEKIKDRKASTIPEPIVTEMSRAMMQARAKRAPARRDQRHNAPKANPTTPTIPPAQLDRRMAALLAHQRAERVRLASEEQARRNGAHPEQVAVAHSNAADLAMRRGTHPDQKVAPAAKVVDHADSK